MGPQERTGEQTKGNRGCPEQQAQRHHGIDQRAKPMLEFDDGMELDWVCEGSHTVHIHVIGEHRCPDPPGGEYIYKGPGGDQPAAMDGVKGGAGRMNSGLFFDDQMIHKVAIEEGKDGDRGEQSPSCHKRNGSLDMHTDYDTKACTATSATASAGRDANYYRSAEAAESG